jgi:hypothetical protein
MKHNNSNILQLNNTSTNNYSNNIVEIYGKTSLYGKVNISAEYNTITNYTSHLLNIEGSLNATTIYGNGNNITNLDADKITSGSILVSRGGTGLNSITPNLLLFGSGDGIMKQDTRFKIESGLLVAQQDATNITAGSLPILHGGTGLNSCGPGRIMYGPSAINDPLKTSQDFVFSESTKTLNVSNLQLINELRFNKLKKKNSTGDEYRDLVPNDVGISIASSHTAGIVRLGSSFLIDEVTGILSIAPLSIGSELWGRGLPSTDYVIMFPPEETANLVGKIGINIKRPNHTLDVKGAINT